MDNLAKYSYCLVILDSQLLGIGSMETLRIMCLTKQIPILMLAASTSSSDEFALFQSGADGDVCMAQADTLIQHHSNMDVYFGPNGEIAYGTELVLLPRFRQVSIDGKSLPLTRKEYDLLYYFAGHPRQVFSREQLYSQV